MIVSLKESNASQVLLLNNWIVRVRQPETRQSNKIFLMLHGYTGDENSMLVFMRNLPTDAWIFAPRGPEPVAEGGYRWLAASNGLETSLSDFQTPVQKINTALSDWLKSFHIPDAPINIIGFSQGAALALAYTLTYPRMVKRAACLAGFLPPDAIQLASSRPLEGIPIFISHGTQDTTVTYDRAQQTAAWLEQLGAVITFCTSQTGHRISAACFRAYSDFFHEP